MKRSILSIAVLLLSLASLFAQEDVSESRWKTKDIVIDGNDNEWSQPFNFFDNASGLIFTVANDNKNIYLCFSNNDRAKMGKMMTAGWSIEMISSEKKRKFDVSIAFPKSADPNINMRSDLKTAVGLYKAETQMIKTKGFTSNAGDMPLTSKDGINIGIGADDADKIIYEIKIPFKELMEEDKAQLNELITLNITVNALEKPSGSGSSSSTPAARMGGGRGGGGGRMGGRGGGGRGGGNYENAGSSDRFAMFDKANFKQKIKLVSK
jgi:hypothetical protein